MEDEAYEVYEDHISAAEEASHKRTKKQQAKADKAEAQADAAAAEMEAKRQREAALDRNKDRLREENRELLTNRLEQLLEAEAQMALERTRECVARIDVAPCTRCSHQRSVGTMLLYH